jgi:hypothetical protein
MDVSVVMVVRGNLLMHWTRMYIFYDIDCNIGNIGAFCLRMRENRSVRLQMADLLGGCEFCHGFYEKYGLNFCSISQNSLLYILEFGPFSQALYFINIFVNNRDQGIATF